MKKRVVVFGIFDGVHEGHRNLFAQALLQAQAVRGSEEPSGHSDSEESSDSMSSQRGKAKEDVELVVIVGRDSASLKWKGKKPKRSQQTRLSLVMKEEGVSDAVLGDEEQSSYKILKNLHPDVVCVGYDQNDLEQDLRTWLSQKGKYIPLIRLKPYQPDLYHNSSHPQPG